MLPILRIISVGGVFLAIAILILALIPPGGSHLVMAGRDVGARGVLADQGQHPEWRQFLLQSALRRYGELERLRSLPDTVIRTPLNAMPADDEPAASETTPDIAGLPIIIQQATPDDITGSIDENPGATIPIEIGETSSTELPVMPVEERPPISGVPALQAPPVGPQSALTPAAETTGKAKMAKPPRHVVQQRGRRKSAARPPAEAPAAQVPPPFNILVAIFGGLANASANDNTATAQSSAAAKPASPQPYRTPAIP